MNENPLSEPISTIWKEIKKLHLRGVGLIASPIVFLIFLFVLVLLIILYPYGVIITITQYFAKLMGTEKERIQNQEDWGVRFGQTIVVGVYGFVWILFSVICLPAYLVGKFINTILYIIDFFTVKSNNKS